METIQGPKNSLEFPKVPMAKQWRHTIVHISHDARYLPEHSSNIKEKVGEESKAFATANPERSQHY